MRSGEFGFTLVELLIVVAIIGIIVAMAVPNLTTALDTSRQRRTMADMRQLGSAIEMYSVDNYTYPRVASYGALTSYLQPTYMRAVPATDGWGHSWGFEGDTTSGLQYTLISHGKDGAPGPIVGGETRSFNCDIVYANGNFFQWPSGTQN